MTQTNLANVLCLSMLILGVAGCSSAGYVDLGGTAGTGNSAGAAGAASSAGSPEVPQQINGMIVQLGATEYNYSCPNGAGSSSSELWVGPYMAANALDEQCPWPHPNPLLSLSVHFTGFLRSVGFAPGTYDLAEQVKQNVVVEFSTHGQGELPVGQSAPYAIYSSSPTGAYSAGGPTTPAVGTSGTVTVVEYGPQGTFGGANCDVSLSNVVLPMQTNTGGDFPSTVTIKSARFLHQLH